MIWSFQLILDEIVSNFEWEKKWQGLVKSVWWVEVGAGWAETPLVCLDLVEVHSFSGVIFVCCHQLEKVNKNSELSEWKVEWVEWVLRAVKQNRTVQQCWLRCIDNHTHHSWSIIIQCFILWHNPTLLSIDHSLQSSIKHTSIMLDLDHSNHHRIEYSAIQINQNSIFPSLRWFLIRARFQNSLVFRSDSPRFQTDSASMIAILERSLKQQSPMSKSSVASAESKPANPLAFSVCLIQCFNCSTIDTGINIQRF